MAIDVAYINERITRSKARIEALEDAILAVSTRNQTYTFDTGQTRQSVTKANLSELRIALEHEENRLARLCRQLEVGGGAIISRPGF